MSRNQLHLTHLDPFKQWLEENGYEHKPGVGIWEVLRVRKGTQWYGIYKRLNMKEHYSVDSRMNGLVHRFIIESKAKKAVS